MKKFDRYVWKDPTHSYYRSTLHAFQFCDLLHTYRTNGCGVVDRLTYWIYGEVSFVLCVIQSV